MPASVRRRAGRDMIELGDQSWELVVVEKRLTDLELNLLCRCHISHRRQSRSLLHEPKGSNWEGAHAFDFDRDGKEAKRCIRKLAQASKVFDNGDFCSK